METWKNPATIALWISIGLIVVFVLAVSIVFLMRANVQRYAQAKTNESELKFNHSQKLVETQEKERTRIAADLHDGLIGKLMAIRLRNKIGHHADELDQSIEESIITARRISHDLAPPMLEHTDLKDVLADLITPWKAHYKISYVHDVYHEPCSTEIKLHLSRCTQEIMRNTFKHAEATRITIHLQQKKDVISVLIKDNGIGFSPEIKSKGIGLDNLRSRMRTLNGKLELQSNYKEGTSILLSIPILNKQIHA